MRFWGLLMHSFGNVWRYLLSNTYTWAKRICVGFIVWTLDTVQLMPLHFSVSFVYFPLSFGLYASLCACFDTDQKKDPNHSIVRERRGREIIVSSIVPVLLVLVLVYIFIVRFKFNLEIYLLQHFFLRSVSWILHWKPVRCVHKCIICVLFLFNANC